MGRAKSLDFVAERARNRPKFGLKVDEISEIYGQMPEISQKLSGNTASTSLRYDVTIVPPGTVSGSHFESVPGWPNFLPFEASDWFRICASESHRAPPLEAQLVDVGPWSRKEQE